MRGRLAFLAAVLVAAVVAVAAMSSGTGSVPRNVRGTLTQMVMAMRADDGPQVCSLMTASGETFFLGLAYPKHGPCGPLATAILKRVKWTEPLAQALHGIAGQPFVASQERGCRPNPAPLPERLWSNVAAASRLHAFTVTGS